MWSLCVLQQAKPHYLQRALAPDFCARIQGETPPRAPSLQIYTSRSQDLVVFTPNLPFWEAQPRQIRSLPPPPWRGLASRLLQRALSPMGPSSPFPVGLWGQNRATDTPTVPWGCSFWGFSP